MKYGQKCGGKNRKIGLTFFAGKCRNFFFHRKVENQPPNKIFKNNFAAPRCPVGQIAIFSKKMHFLEKNGFFTPSTASLSKVVLELFVWGLISYLPMKKNIPALSGKKSRTNFSIFTPTFLAIIHQFQSSNSFKQ